MLIIHTGYLLTLYEDLISEVISSQKCHMNVGLILDSYGCLRCSFA